MNLTKSQITDFYRALELYRNLGGKF
jgi:hypothetical protein